MADEHPGRQVWDLAEQATPPSSGQFLIFHASNTSSRSLAARFMGKVKVQQSKEEAPMNTTLCALPSPLNLKLSHQRGSAEFTYQG
jgi:hypothetical protein